MSTTVLSVVDVQAIFLSFFVPEADWQGRFTHLEVWRSQSGEGGVYELMLASSWLPAQLPVDGFAAGLSTGGSLNISGKSLDLLLNETLSLSYVFTGVDPLTKADCATQLAAALPAYLNAFVDTEGKFVVTTTQAGAVASLRVKSSDAAVLLGLPTTDPDNLAYGKDARIPFQPGVLSYSFRDPFGKTTHAYKTRMFNNLTLEASAFSEPVSGAVRTAVDPSQVIVGYVSLMGLDGRAVKDREVLLYNNYTSAQIQDFTIVNEGQRKLTNADGYVEFPLLRGITVDLLLPGTGLARRVVAPTDPAINRFNLLDPLYGDNDAFSVQRPDFAYAERRSL